MVVAEVGIYDLLLELLRRGADVNEENIVSLWLTCCLWKVLMS